MTLKSTRQTLLATERVVGKSASRARNGSVRRRGSGHEAERSRSALTQAEKALIAANRYLVREYPLGVLAGTPRRLSLQKSDLWIVPILLTSPGYGAVGEVGVVAVNARTGRVVGGTPKEEVIAAGKRLREEKRDEIEAAFRRARTV
jgi:hypothetical protein